MKDTDLQISIKWHYLTKGARLKTLLEKSFFNLDHHLPTSQIKGYNNKRQNISVCTTKRPRELIHGERCEREAKTRSK